ncbi:MAG: PIG-L deacetylase family protein [Pirellulaceae bacterium]
MNESSPRLLVLGAHPDDAEFHAGGLIGNYRRQGYPVKIVSVTNGAAGHHWRAPEELAALRRDEARAVADRLGAAYEVWEFPDGELQPTLEVRRRIIREIRTFVPDLVLTHRTCDYHPDHRAVGLAVQDASYMVTVPHVVGDVPALRQDPVVAYMNDLFTRPCPLSPDVVIDITDQVDEIVAMLACHRSQVFEWLPYNHRLEHTLPPDDASRLAWLREWYLRRACAVAERFRGALQAAYGADRGSRIACAEAYEISEYASQLSDAQRQRLFPRGPGG